ncbi:DUF4190 domain-containing protein [Streptomyces sp. DH24]|uniref:DUF4190 domain-containing protein n=1 Tax=Streptomyces sp. DH24 TaxID=3040123 RepID=UPI002441AA4A|nr:DUF4190 domain-containing protein [Streptomyces sp. DH24]MDG9720968.1 DUF4190 domain-containing protein [Streptomyces sp. DH24]
MSDDAQQPAAGGESPGRADPRAGTGEGTPGPGPGSTMASGEALTWPAPSVHDQQTVTSLPAMGDGGAPQVPPGSASAPAPGGVPPAPAPYSPWATPVAPPQTSGPGYGGAFAPPPYGAAGSAADPFPGRPFPANPFAAPEDAVPPPPVAPDGPGQVPYGYPGGPGGYGYPGQAAGQGAYGAGAQQGYYGWGAAPLPSNGLGTAGLVLGIVSAAVFCLWPVAIVGGVLAVIFGAVGRAKVSRGEATNAGQALAGIICGAVGIVLGVGFGLLVLLA